MNGVIMVNIAFVSFDKLRLSDMAIETSLCITKNESGTYLSQCQASTVLIIIFIRFIFTFWSEKETKIYRKIDMLPQCGTEHIAFQVHAECSQKCVIALFVALFIRMQNIGGSQNENGKYLCSDFYFIAAKENHFQRQIPTNESDIAHAKIVHPLSCCLLIFFSVPFCLVYRTKDVRMLLLNYITALIKINLGKENCETG